MKKPELLAPAGNMDCLKSAVAAGCDAVYFGGTRFNARHGASGFDIEAMQEAVRYTRLHQVKTLLTVNTLVKETEWQDFTANMDQMAETGIDAVIVQDLGVAQFIRRHYPWIALHGSTQMSVHSPDGVRFLEDLGFQRVVLARELSLEDVRKIRNATDLELEVFIHGALCYSVSGQCLLSSFIGGRSGNRGMCAQPCRLAYQIGDKKPAYLMNLKDMCTLDILPEIMDIGVNSLKIEGRLKSPEYVYGITSGYRAALDSRLAEAEVQDRKQEMAQLFNRGGFSHGYWVRDQKSMIEPESPKHQGLLVGKVSKIRGGRIYVTAEQDLNPQDVLEIRTDRAPFPSYQLQERNFEGNRRNVWVTIDQPVKAGQAVYRLIDQALMQRLGQYEEPKRKASLAATLVPGREAALTAACDGKQVTVLGEIVEKALEKGVSEETIRRSLSKSGGTPFVIDSVEIQTEGPVFLPVSALNDLRRKALSALEDALCSKLQEPYPDLVPGPLQKTDKDTLQLEAVISTEEQWQAVKQQRVDHVWFRKERFPEARLQELFDEAADLGMSAGLSLPYFDLMGTWDKKDAKDLPVLVHNLGQIAAHKPASVHCDLQIPVMNRTAADLLGSYAASVTLSVESSAEELSKFGQAEDAVIAYGKIPVMTTRQCLQKEGDHCLHGQGGRTVPIRDRKDVSWIAELHCGADCYNVLYTGQPLWMADRSMALLGTGAGIWRLLFLDEDYKETEAVLEAYKAARAGKTPKITRDGSIRGHFFKPCL